jgi:hypothetical protein
MEKIICNKAKETPVYITEEGKVLCEHFEGRGTYYEQCCVCGIDKKACGYNGFKEKRQTFHFPDWGDF